MKKKDAKTKPSAENKTIKENDEGLSKNKRKDGSADIEAMAKEIPEDEIWTYRVPGLSAPRIHEDYSKAKSKKIIFVAVIIVAISLSIYFSVRAVQSDPFKFKQNDSGYTLTKFTNTGYITKLNIGYVTDVEYFKDVNDPKKNYKIIEDKSKKVTAIDEYAFNCDEKITTINIGASVTDIKPMAFYSCYALKNFTVDKNNPKYTDIDGVLYTKDGKELVCMPIDYDSYLREKNGYKEALTPDDSGYDVYKKKCATYVVPETVEEIGPLSCNYNEMVSIYLPSGLKNIDTLAFFKAVSLEKISTYEGSADKMTKVYLSLPEGLEEIGSDAFSYDQALDYMFIPKNVKKIGHHAFWETAYKQDGNILGINEMNVERSESEFGSVETGDQWIPKFDSGLFRKNIPINYSSERKNGS
jgi:hypothetical protein